MLVVPPDACAASGRKKVIAKMEEDSDADDGISCGLMLVSINCPLSQMRMEQPCRGTGCTHLQCFGAKSYLMFNARKTVFLAAWA